MPCAKSAISRTLLAAVATALAGCGVVRPSDFSPICPEYEVTIRPIVEARCGECHSAVKAAGGYIVGDHVQTVSRNDDGTPRVAPGDLASPFLAAARGELSGHPTVAVDEAEVTRLEDWVVRCRGAPLPHQFHPKGWATSTDPDQFHGVFLRDAGYNFSICKKCHGDDLRGGEARVDCNNCHRAGPLDCDGGTAACDRGPLSCNTCHGDKDSAAPPRDLHGVRLTTSLGVGAHRAHVQDGAAHKAYGCAKCHLDVKDPNDEGHYRRAGKFLYPAPAEVRLPSGPTGDAGWDRTTATCSNVYCHAPSKTDTAPTRMNPVWTRAGKGDIKCGSCHGAPPSSHADNRCALCHGAGYYTDGVDGGVDLALHINGKVNLRNGGEKCDSCHAGPDSPAFVDLRGRTSDAGVQTVGAHDAHLHASRLRGPLSCNDCHRVPLTVTEPGHLDHPPPAKVFPANLGNLAWTQGAMPTYNAANATCSGVYCHGGGDFGHPDTASTLMRNPVWTGKTDQAACGTCHGLPPVDGTIGHIAALTTPCVTCHPGTVLPDGGIVFSTLPDGGLTSKHMDGKITGQ